MTHQALFNFISENVGKYVYVTLFVRIEEGFNITEIDWHFQQFGLDVDEKQLYDDLRAYDDWQHFSECKEEGWYALECLLTVQHDSDDEQHWCWYEVEEARLEFQISNEELNRQNEEFNLTIDDSDLFNFDKL